jgi:poly(3-hydroxybutyrate) depolymerase
MLAVELRIPQVQKAKFPAVVLIHGSGGAAKAY